MVYEFILPYGQLNLALLTYEERETIWGTGLLEEKVVEIFEYEKNNDNYWDGAKLYQQVINKALLIAEAPYLGYSLFLLFDNATSYSVYTKDALQIKDMNKSSGGKQPVLRNSWFEKVGTKIAQPRNFLNDKNELLPKGIQQILEEKGLWPAKS